MHKKSQVDYIDNRIKHTTL